jgi:LA2681-like HEPN
MEGKVPINEIKKIFFMPADFFREEGFLDRYKKQMSFFSKQIREGTDKEKIKDSLNVFFLASIQSQKDEDVKLEVQLIFFSVLNGYAQQYDSKETYRNIIKAFENEELKQKLFTKFTSRAKIIYAETLFMYHSLLKSESPFYSAEKTQLLIEAKSHIWKVFINHINGTRLNKTDLSECLILLSSILIELSRWYEGLYYLDVAKSHLDHNPNIEYLRANLIDSMKDKTCLDGNYLLILRIIESCNEAIKLPNIMKEQKEQLIKMETAARKFLSDKEITLKKLRIHKGKIAKSFNKYNHYKKFCLENQIFLNEHSFFCTCKLSLKDSLKIETAHKHTKIEWVQQFEKIINVLVSDFIIARHNFYYSQDKISLPGFNIRLMQRKNSTDEIKKALLKNSFKVLYSLLDQIGFGIFKVLEIDFDSKLKTQSEEGKIPKLDFLKMWDENYKLFNEEHFANNFYLNSLYSIAKDLDKSKSAALRGFKEIRNALEHRLLFVTDSASNPSVLEYSKQDLTEKTKILMHLTKSAIYSFTYLIRVQSKLKEPSKKEPQE